MNAFKQGRENERRSVKLLESRGWLVYKPARTRFSWMGNTDIFGLFDIIAVRECLVLFVQVKTNYARPEVFRGIKEFKEKYDFKAGSPVCFQVHVWSKVKNKWSCGEVDV